MAKPAVLHIIDGLTRGGAERLLVDVINAMPGFTHHLVSISSKLDLADQLPEGLPLTSLGFRGKKDSFSAIRKIRKYIRENKIELVHSHLALANVLARIATPRDIPLFVSLHSQNGIRLFRNRWSLPSMVERYTYAKRHSLIAVSKTVLDDYDKYVGIKGDAHVLHNFVEDKFFAAAPRNFVPGNALRMVSVGTIKAAKNYEFLVEAFKGLPPNCSLDIYGGGPLKESLQEKIASANVNIRLCGPRTDIASIYPEYDLFVMSSTVEGHPVALVEAMASGLPALLSDIPVLHEATGGKGLFFSLQDPAAFREKVKDIQSGSISLNEYAAHNHHLAGQSARKEQYLQKLTDIYLAALNRMKQA